MRARKAAEEHERESLEAARQPARGAAGADAARHRGGDPARDPGDPQRGRRSDGAGDREGDAQGARRRGPAAPRGGGARRARLLGALGRADRPVGARGLGGDRTGLFALAVRGREGARQARRDQAAARRVHRCARAEPRAARCSSSRPTSRREEKKQGLGRALVDAEPEFLNFLELLIENHRMPVIYPCENAIRRAVGAPRTDCCRSR